MNLNIAQTQVYFDQQVDKLSPKYNVGGYLKFSGQFDLALLEQAWLAVLETFDAFSIEIICDAASPSQRLRATRHFPITKLDFTGGGPEQALAWVHANKDIAIPMDAPALHESTFLHVAEQEWWLHFKAHHIILDGYSFALALENLSSQYRSRLAGSACGREARETASPFFDCLPASDKYRQSPAFQKDREYWQARFAHHSPSPLFQSAFQGSAASVGIDLELPLTLKNKWQHLSEQLSCGFQELLMACLYIYVQAVHGADDLCIGVPTHGRRSATERRALGMFAQVMPVSLQPDHAGTFRDLIDYIKTTFRADFKHGRYPLSDIVSYHSRKNGAYCNLFDIVATYLEFDYLFDFGAIQSGLAVIDSDFVAVPLTIKLRNYGADAPLLLSIKARGDVFDDAALATLSARLLTIFDSIALDGNPPLHQIDLLDAAQRKHLLDDLNATAKDYPRERCIHELFEAQARQTPDAVAVVLDQQTLSYGELNARANQLAHYLIDSHHIMPDTLVGICLDRSLELVIGILAILKAGGAYVPLDPAYPQARLAFMLDDARVHTVLTQTRRAGSAPYTGYPALCLDSPDLPATLHRYPADNPDARQRGLTSSHLAYVIYTSGSSGNPKGSLLQHSGLCNLALAQIDAFAVHPDSRVLQFASIAFDAATSELWMALLCGARLVMLSPQTAAAPDALSACVAQQRVTHATLPPALLPSLAPAQWRSVKTLVVAGDSCSERLADEWSQGRRLLNAYGPSETTVCATIGAYQAGQPAMHMGKPIQNVQVYVVHPSLRLAPMGATGELLIGGAGLSRGYLNRPDLNEQKFIDSPFHNTADGAGTRLYRTGDLVRWLPDGNLQFVGRVDQQVKIRGFRIEPGEVERTLATHPQVKDAVVLASNSRTAPSDRRLLAYVVTNDGRWREESGGRDALVQSIWRHARHCLPEYMVPAAITPLDQFPLTANGKVDRRALPEPDMAGHLNSDTAPRTRTEKLLCEIWQTVLGVERVGITDNFFQLGGHSLLVMQVMSRLQQHGLSPSAQQLFATPSLADLARTLDDMAPHTAFRAPPNLIPADCEHITPDMLPMVDLNAEDIARIVAQVPHGAPNVQDIYPLAPLQEGILFHHMLHGQRDPYVLPSLFKIRGKAAVTQFIAALQQVIDRHDVLRTAIFWQELPVPVQVVCRQATLPVTWLALAPGQDAETAMRALCAPAEQSMALGQAPLLHARIAADSRTDQFYLLLQLHHIICDHVGLDIIRHEIAALQAGQAARLAPPLPYREFVAHTRHQALHNRAEEFFITLLADVEQPTAPFDLLDVKGDGSRIVEARAALAAPVAERIRVLARQLRVSAAAIFHAAWALVVAGCSARDDVVFGTVLSGRLQGAHGADSMLGVFVNTLPFRVRLAQVDAGGLVRQVHETLLGMLPYEQASLALAQRCSRLPGGVPLFSAMLNFRHSAAPQGGNDGAQYDVGPLAYIGGQERTNYPFNMAVDDLGHGFTLEAQVDQAVGAERVLAYMQTAVDVLTDALDRAPHRAAGTLSILHEAERRQLLAAWNDTATPFPEHACIHALFEAQAAKRPDACAIRFEQQQLSYAELNAKANQLAHWLIAQRHIGPDTLVGICMERSLDMVVGMLAILKAGGAYVPLDPAYPRARLAYMLGDAKLGTVLTQRPLRAQIPVSDAQALCLDSEPLRRQLQSCSSVNPTAAQRGLDSRHLAYVIYTSGSTGAPKGVMVEHANVVNFLVAMASQPGITETDCLLAVTSTSFDIHGLELFLPLASGASLVLASQSASGDPAALMAAMAGHRVSLMQATPATWKMLLEAGWRQAAPLKVLCGGEALSQSLARGLLSQPQIELWNMYGPTETTIWSCVKRITSSEQPVLIGRPIANTQVYIASDAQALTPAPLGVAGELLIGGAGVARGYLGRPELTAERFIAHPFHEAGQAARGARLYRTGDLARWTADGNLEYLGRLDHQVKVRGFRIELGEIESALGAHAAVRDAVVVAQESGLDNGDWRLIAYVVTDQADPQDDSEDGVNRRLELIGTLRRHVSLSLPSYMVPAVFVLLKQLPLTPNGKIDRKSLPGAGPAALPVRYSAPQTATERILCELWQEVLGIERVGVTENFFQLGGHSLLAIRIAALAGYRGLDLPVKQVMETRHIRELAQALANPAGAPGGTSADSGTHPGQYLGPLPIAPNLAYSLAVKNDDIDSWLTTRLLACSGPLDQAALAQALQLLIRRHDVLRLRLGRDDEGNWCTEIVEYGGEAPLSSHDFRDVPDTLFPSRADDVHAQMKSRSSIATGPLIQLALFDYGSGMPSRLMICVHHYAADAVSLDILLQDLAHMYAALAQGAEPDLPRRAPGYADYVFAIEHYARSRACLDNMDYWLAPQRLGDHNIPVDTPGPHLDGWRLRNFNTVTALDAPALARADGYDALQEMILAALLLAYAQWSGKDYLHLNLVNNGRTVDAYGHDFSRTAGWISYMNPVVLRTGARDDCLATYHAVSGQIRSIPRDNSFNILKYCHPSQEVRRRMRAIPEPQINFNYFSGASDNHIAVQGGDRAIRFTSMSSPLQPGVEIAVKAGGKLEHYLALTCNVADGEVRMNWMYVVEVFGEAGMRRFSQLFDASLRELAANAVAPSL